MSKVSAAATYLDLADSLESHLKSGVIHPDHVAANDVRKAVALLRFLGEKLLDQARGATGVSA